MMQAHRQEVFDFTLRYIFALSIIAILSLLAYFNLSYLIGRQAQFAKIINISGRQRMLSQQIALFSIYYKTKALKKAKNEMSKNHRFITTLPDLPESVQRIFFNAPYFLDKRVKQYIQNAEIFLSTRGGKNLTYILTNAQPLQEELNKAVFAFQKESERLTEEIESKERMILLLTFLTLFAEALFIFRPINRKFRERSRALSQEKQYADTITESAPAAIIVIDDALGVRRFNRHAEKIFGYSKSQMIGKNSLYNIIPPQYRQGHDKGVKDFFATGKLKHETRPLEMEAMRKNGDIFPIRISFGASSIESGSRIVVANIIDITKEREQERKMQQQSRIAALGEMIGNIAHQWRQPLSSIRTVASGIKVRKKAGFITDEEIIKGVEKINEYTEYLSDTIDDFRNFFREDRKPVSFEIDQVIAKTVSLTEASFKHNHIETAIIKEDRSFRHCGYPNELAQVILNLFNNSKSILLERKVEEKFVLVSLFKEGGTIIIEVCDSAKGVPEEIIMKIFDPYFTTRHKAQGTGMGLYMSKQIVEQHFHGLLTVQNRTFTYNGKSYKGACFRIELPEKEC